MGSSRTHFFLFGGGSKCLSPRFGSRRPKLGSAGFIPSTGILGLAPVDSRYQKVAKGKSCLCRLILIQAVVQLVASIPLILSVTKEEVVDALSASSLAILFVCHHRGARSGHYLLV